MGVAVVLEDGVVSVVTTMAFAEHVAGWADVGPVQEDGGVEPRHSGVHGGNAGVGYQELPRAGEVGTCGDKGEKQPEAEGEREGEIHEGEQGLRVKE